jgi:hypothetical protein
MIKNTNSASLLVFHQPLGLVARVFLIAGGVLALSAPHELLIRPGVPLLQWGMLPFWIIGVLAGMLGALFLLAGILGRTHSPERRADRRPAAFHPAGHRCRREGTARDRYFRAGAGRHRGGGENPDADAWRGDVVALSYRA